MTLAADVVPRRSRSYREQNCCGLCSMSANSGRTRRRRSNEAARIGSEYVPRRYFGSVAGRPLHGRCPHRATRLYMTFP